MSSFREEAAAMAAAYEEVQINQQELDEGIGKLVSGALRGGAKLLGRGGRAVGRAATSPSARSAASKAVKKAAKPAAIAGGAAVADQYFTGGKGRRSLGRAARDLHNTAREVGHNLPEYGGRNSNSERDNEGKGRTDGNKDKDNNSSGSSRNDSSSSSSGSSSGSSSSQSSSQSSSTGSGTKQTPSTKPPRSQRQSTGSGSSKSSNKGNSQYSSMSRSSSSDRRDRDPDARGGYDPRYDRKNEQMEHPQDQRLTSDLMKSLGDAYDSMYDLAEGSQGNRIYRPSPRSN